MHGAKPLLPLLPSHPWPWPAHIRPPCCACPAPLAVLCAWLPICNLAQLDLGRNQLADGPSLMQVGDDSGHGPNPTVPRQPVASARAIMMPARCDRPPDRRCPLAAPPHARTVTPSKRTVGATCLCVGAAPLGPPCHTQEMGGSGRGVLAALPTPARPLHVAHPPADCPGGRWGGRHWQHSANSLPHGPPRPPVSWPCMAWTAGAGGRAAAADSYAGG